MSAGAENIMTDYETHNDSDSVANYIHDYMYGGIPSQICYHIMIILPTLIGSLLAISIVLYEQFGADRQKRTIINRFLPFIIANLMISILTWNVVRLIRNSYGLLPYQWIAWEFYLRKWLNLSTVFFYNQLTIFRFLYIVVWKRVKVINDEFWITVLSMSTYLITFFFCIIVYLLGTTFGTSWGLIEVTNYESQYGKRYTFNNIGIVTFDPI